MKNVADWRTYQSQDQEAAGVQMRQRAQRDGGYLQIITKGGDDEATEKEPQGCGKGS